VLFSFAHKAAGASRARLSLRPLISEGGIYWQTSDASRRENAELYQRHCEEQRDEAIHSCFAARWIASLALAMTVVVAV
jgi:hypothetical protein